MGTEKLTPVEHLACLRDEIYLIQMKICVAQKAKDERIQELDAMVMDLASVRDEAYDEIVRKDRRIEELKWRNNFLGKEYEELKFQLADKEELEEEKRPWDFSDLMIAFALGTLAMAAVWNIFS